MRISPRFWVIAVAARRLLQGRTLHRAALESAAGGEFELADQLFEAAAERYREDLRVPSLARLRVHQLMVRATGASANPDAAVESLGEIERRLLALDRIEDLAPPFAEIDAPELMARWSARLTAEAHRHAA